MKAPLGVLLAGGRATRMGGGDKGLLRLGSSSILDHVIARLAPQCDGLVLNANGDPARFDYLGLTVLPDSVTDHPGPLAGVLAGLDHAARTGHDYIVTAAADTPFLPCDLVPQLQLAAEESNLALAASPSGRQPTFGLWPVSLREPLRTALAAGTRKVVQFTQAHGGVFATFPDDAAFFNVNTPEDLARARAMA
ncbi:molybdenum cofactor guanylyltransferase MobA [Salipiger sp. IMCC34102]|uniref:molybdenum cofactor guanylyltransferase MobA n=1 Tax=Salipiger sp. IMCC34102 TaxID=2510647 RepID=UPI00101D15D6|nr:molybdenum cofactor guanylyltransferase MobA [Salipiger sp. IMCC34102]RYH01638.1 molybdenum cofactor guanylyltransferase MobA [Salipiger sp. IMCC34102]